MNEQRRGRRAPDMPEGVSISIKLTDYDIDATLDQFAKKLRDTADIIDHIGGARLAGERDFLMIGGMVLDFGHVVDPLRAVVRMETPALITEGVNPLYGGVLVAGNETSTVEIFKDAYDLITKGPKTMTLRELAKLRAEHHCREIEAIRRYEEEQDGIRGLQGHNPNWPGNADRGA